MSHTIASRNNPPAQHGLRFGLVHIVNHDDLLAVYGLAVIDDIAAFIDDQFRMWGRPGPSVSLDGSYIFVDFGEGRAIAACDQDILAEQINALLSFGPFVCGTDEVFLRVETTFIQHHDSAPMPERQNSLLPAHSYDLSSGRASDFYGRTAAYKADMVAAVGLFSQLSARALVLAFQPVVAAGNNSSVIYWEALLRLETDDAYAGHSTCTDSIVSLERSGLVSRIDRSVIWTVLALLEEHKGIRVACNISARSLQLGCWWRVLFNALRQRPGVASRLVIEITETSAITHEDEAFIILKALKALGCKIAIDDFGAGYSTLDFVVRLRPDFIKIDKAYLSSAPGVPSSEPASLLRNLVQLCKCICPCVVSEGIESELHRSEAIEAGAQGLQGYLFGMPHVLPYWRKVPVVVRDAFEPGHPSHAQREPYPAHAEI